MAKKQAKPAKEPTKPTSGGARLKAAGLHAQLLGWTQEDWDTLTRASAVEKRSWTSFVMFHTIEAAKKILSKNGDSP